MRLAAACAVVAMTAGAAGCAGASSDARIGRSASGSGADQQAVRQPSTVRLLGDGSTSDTGPQPHQPVPYRLVTGEEPPQFVVFSFDGAAEDARGLLSRFRTAGERSQAAMTYFLSGTSLLPAGRQGLSVPPGGTARRKPGSLSGDLRSIADTLRELREVWQDGSEVGTSFNAPSCGQYAGSDRWTAVGWSSEIRQAEGFVAHWKTNTGLVDEDPLPFDVTRNLAGGRAPCPGASPALISASAAAGFRYDASGAVGRQVWPAKRGGLWEFPLPSVVVPGGARQAPATDSGPLGRGLGREQVHDILAAAFERSYRGNRAPLFVGAHFATAGDAYLAGVADTIADVCARPGVRCVSFKQLADWLDTQDSRVLARLRTLQVGQAPDQGWERFVAAAKR